MVQNLKQNYKSAFEIFVNEIREIFMSKSRIEGLSLASFLVLILFATTGFAQSGSATVQGTVKDPQGNLVRGATVTLTDAAKNFSRTQQTNADGAYVFTAIPP